MIDTLGTLLAWFGFLLAVILGISTLMTLVLDFPTNTIKKEVVDSKHKAERCVVGRQGTCQ